MLASVTRRTNLNANGMDLFQSRRLGVLHVANPGSFLGVILFSRPRPLDITSSDIVASVVAIEVCPR
jgi:hypothetical protein